MAAGFQPPHLLLILSACVCRGASAAPVPEQGPRCVGPVPLCQQRVPAEHAAHSRRRGKPCPKHTGQRWAGNLLARAGAGGTLQGDAGVLFGRCTNVLPGRLCATSCLVCQRRSCHRLTSSRRPLKAMMTSLFARLLNAHQLWSSRRFWREGARDTVYVCTTSGGSEHASNVLQVQTGASLTGRSRLANATDRSTLPEVRWRSLSLPAQPRHLLSDAAVLAPAAASQACCVGVRQHLVQRGLPAAPSDADVTLPAPLRGPPRAA